MNKKTLIRGETLSINVHIDYNKLPITGIAIDDIAAEAWFQNNIRIPLTVTKIDGDGNYNLFSDIDTSKLVGDSFLVNVGIKDITGDAPSNITMASFNETFYIVNSATRLPAEYFTIRFIDYDGVIISIQKARPFDELIVPPSPSREGYDFSRWTPTLNTKIIASVDYTATYVEKTPVPVAGGHSVVYYLDKEYYTCQNYDEGDTIVPPTPTETGYTFTGWTGLPSPLIMPDRCVVANGKMISPASEGLEFILRDVNGNDSDITGLPATQAWLMGRGGCMDTNVVIPETYNNLPVNRIEGFRNDQNLLREIVVPESVKSIRNAAFYNNFTLQKVTLPETEIYLGNACFSGCQSLSSINLSENCSFEANIFEVCKSLKNLDLPSNMVEITNYFLRQSGIEKIVIPPRVVRIGFHSFYLCEDLTEVHIPLATVQIYGGAFGGCNSLSDVYYEGTQEQWNAIQISSGNEPLENANIHYGSYNQ